MPLRPPHLKLSPLLPRLQLNLSLPQLEFSLFSTPLQLVFMPLHKPLRPRQLECNPPCNPLSLPQLAFQPLLPPPQLGFSPLRKLFLELGR
ncbi:hypothetical protein BU16DRAFT_529915 [Lophium mytilinum]|uniref:Uncharacterized protein n=1 Tax=Lophium mytilinum TaxID=390894 RepID=A0A6A6QH93_9PEZI|nr:hypothetical protein BU16DRAFT_529915 [Lophium mytilinum]